MRSFGQKRASWTRQRGCGTCQAFVFSTYRDSRLVLRRLSRDGTVARARTCRGLGRDARTGLPAADLNWYSACATAAGRGSAPSGRRCTASLPNRSPPLPSPSLRLPWGWSVLGANAGLGLVAVLFLTFIYYATWATANSLGIQGTIPGWLAGWLPVFLYGAAGVALLAISWRR